jgi:hypothetical protein
MNGAHAAWKAEVAKVVACELERITPPAHRALDASPVLDDHILVERKELTEWELALGTCLQGNAPGSTIAGIRAQIIMAAAAGSCFPTPLPVTSCTDC